MKYLFPGAVVVLFLGASVTCYVARDASKGTFYLLSALININVLFLK